MEIVREHMGLSREGYRTDPALMEINFGDWQGSTWDELREKAPQAIAERFADPWNVVAPGNGGESYAMLSARAIAWLNAVRRDTVVVTHGGVNRCIRSYLEKLAVEDIPSFARSAGQGFGHQRRPDNVGLVSLPSTKQLCIV